jgi:hypothetical protein
MLESWTKSRGTRIASTVGCYLQKRLDGVDAQFVGEGFILRESSKDSNRRR